MVHLKDTGIQETHLVVVAVRFIGCTTVVVTAIRSSTSIPHRTLRLMCISSFLLVVRVCSATVDVCEGNSIGSATMVSIGRFDTLVAGAALLGLHASASVEEASFGQAELGGGSFLVADVVGVGLAGAAAAAAEEPEQGGDEDEGGGEPSHSKHVAGQADLDVVVLELFVQS